MDLTGLLDELNGMGEDLTLKTKPSKAAARDPLLGASAGGGGGPRKPMMFAKARAAGVAAPKGKRNGKGSKHATHGACPVELMTEFLVLVSAGKMPEALLLCPQILKHEPDNPLIKMYQEAMSEYVQRGLAAEEEDEEEEDDEEEDEDEDEDDGAKRGAKGTESDSGDGSDSDADSEDDDDDKEESKASVGEDERKESGTPLSRRQESK